ncbi:Thiol-disulfide isomerase and thioredoxins [Hahella chejuensis KCTC 2396]|uniref:Thiol-disulfide isomerase and thioredoxins n=1 Tax=Hahella chejuensis (strain KCTC 2396) TaxID=349521 RepID=Q2SIY5_HAHCH|nr:TlpA disulfide reductase family protein [Hahella chejuensis]ABC29389.1 Thiol-disulfide isomerase and thioredoxins [Hahella chejuensis KCTC 2396]
MKTKFFKSVAALCFVLSASVLSLGAGAAEIKGPAADFTLKSSLGKNLRLQEYRGQVVLINFWASWCGPCRQEMPILEDIYKKYEKFGFTIFAVNVDEDSSLANEFLKDTKVTFPILYDNQNKVSRLYDVKAMPTTVIVDRNGNMRYLHKGYQPGTEDHYVKEVKALIRE